MVNVAADGVKQVAKLIPSIKRLVRDRDNLLIERARAVEHNNQLTLENLSMLAENKLINQTLEAQKQKIDQLVTSRDALERERDELIGHLDRISGEKEIETHQFVRPESDFDPRTNELLETLARHGEVPFVPNGHFYSPITSREELLANSSTIFAKPPADLPGINLRVANQLALVSDFEGTYQSLPFQSQAVEGLRYKYDNTAYGYADAIYLYSMIRHVKPKRIVEVGSGYSSCVTMDTNELWFANSIQCTFVEPYPELLYSLLKKGDLETISVLPTRVQDVNFDPFGALESNDILFIDSTHVSKIGSDVNHLFFKVLPNLASGVFVHIHDIFYPFEYPKDWAMAGRAWNEDYLLHAFLQNNSQFEIILFGDYLAQFHRNFLEEKLPLTLKNSGGSIWLRKR